MLLLFPTKIASQPCALGFMPKHGLFTPIGNTCDKGNNNLANSQRKMRFSLNLPLQNLELSEKVHIFAAGNLSVMHRVRAPFVSASDLLM